MIDHTRILRAACITCLSAVALLPGCSVFEPGSTAISGLVTIDGEHARGWTVRAYTTDGFGYRNVIGSARTDGNGRYELTVECSETSELSARPLTGGVPPDVEVHHPSTSVYTADRLCRGGVGFDFDLRWIPVRLSGTTDVWGSPLADATVELKGPDTTSTVVDSSGAFSFDPVTPGTYSISLSNLDGAVRTDSTSSIELSRQNQNVFHFQLRPDPLPVWRTIEASDSYSCGLTTDSVGYCWGNNLEGRLGRAGDEGGSPAPVTGVRRWQALSPGGRITCGLTLDYITRCWGQWLEGRNPVAVGHAGSWAAISSGYEMACGLAESGTASCWGAAQDFFAPEPIPGDLVWALLSAGGVMTCGITVSGDTLCWVSARREPDAFQLRTVAAGDTLVTVSAGERHACGVSIGGAGFCWGSNDRGQLGNGSTAATVDFDETGPMNVVPVAGGHAWSMISAGLAGIPLQGEQDGGHSCGITVTGEAFCWGGNDWGQLGNGTNGDRTQPVPVAGGHVWTSISAGAGHTCGVVASGEAYCWGRNHDFQLANPVLPRSLVPVLVGGS